MARHLEKRRRLDALIAELRPGDFDRRMFVLFNKKGGPPMDLVGEMMLCHRDLVKNAHWEHLFRLVDQTMAQLSPKARPLRLHEGLFPRKLSSECRHAWGVSYVESVSASIDDGFWIFDRIEAQVVGHCPLITSTVRAPHGVLGTLLMTGFTGGKAHFLRTSLFVEGFIYCDGDVLLGDIRDGVVIARGRICYESNFDGSAVILQLASKSPKLTLFSTAHVGFVVEQRKSSFQVVKVSENSPASRAGLMVGDLVVPATATDEIDEIERALRRAYVVQEDYHLRIRRSGRDIVLNVPFFE